MGSEGGMNVLVLEARRAIDEAIDYPSDPKRVKMNLLGRVRFAMRGQGVQSRLGGEFGRLSQFYVNDWENPYSVPPGAPFLWYRGRQVGGRMHTWARTALRMSDTEFSGYGSDLRETSWPISYGDIAPYYDKVERTLDVVGNWDGIENLPDGQFSPCPPQPPAEELLARLITDRVRLRVIRTRLVRNRRDRAYLPMTLAARTGRLVVRPDAVAS